MSKLDIRKNIALTDFRVPGRLTTWFYHFVMHHFVCKKYHPHYNIIDNPKDCDGPCFIIWNHLSRIDHAFIIHSVYPRPVSMVAGYSEFFRSHLHWAFKMQRIVPKKIYTNDLVFLRAMNRLIKQNACIAFSPEGSSSVYGTGQPSVAGTGKFLKHYGIPVYFVDLKGSYLTSTKHCLDERYGRVEVETRLLFSKEDLKEKSGDEIERIINEKFRFDDFEWSRENNIVWKHKGDLAKNVSWLCYKCPECGEEFTMIEDGMDFKCSHCGAGGKFNDHFILEPYNGNKNIPDTISKWMLFQRKEIIKEIRSNPNYSFSEHVKLGYLPNDHYIKNLGTTEICGEGELTIDHQGVHFVGKKFGEDFNINLSFKEIFTPVTMTSTDHLGWYVDGEYYEFYPERHCYGKILLLVEELHRLHVNEWKNFPRLDEIYK